MLGTVINEHSTFLKAIIGAYKPAGVDIPGGKLIGRSERHSGPLVRPVQSYNSPVEQRFLIALDLSTYGPLPDCDHKHVLVRTMPPGIGYR